MIQVLEEAGIRPDLVIGTSAGSLVAALYASGKSGVELATLAQSMDGGAITDWSFPGRGLIRGEALARFVREHTGGKRIEQMRLPLGIVATDLDSGQGIVFRVGDTGVAVRASSAVPAVFQPVRIGTREYVDGGLVAPVPVRYARQMGAQLVIAVDISEAPDGAATGDAMRMLLQTFSIMGRSINQFELARRRHRAAPQAGRRVRRRLQRRAPAPSRPAATRRRPCWANCGCASLQRHAVRTRRPKKRPGENRAEDTLKGVIPRYRGGNHPQ